ncbi:hypothetical protein L7F22_049496 [Adiantum nelumboides]|nr:hypothetical protein [Adiantum nelumboides]
MSQPSRAVLIFCLANGIDAEEHFVNLAKAEHRKPEFKCDEIGRGVRGGSPPRSSHEEEPSKALDQGGEGMKEAFATDASTQAQAPLTPERKTKSMEDRQAVPRADVGDEAEASAKNNEGASKQKGTTSEALRSPKPRVQPIAKKKMVWQGISTFTPAYGYGDYSFANLFAVYAGCLAAKGDSCTFEGSSYREKAYVWGLGKGKEKAVSVGSQKPHEDLSAQKMQGSEKEKIPSLIELSRVLLQEDRATKLSKPKVDGTGDEKAKQQAKRAKGKGSLVKPTEKVQVSKEVKKPKRKDASAAPNLIKASEQPMKRKLSLQAATLGSPSKRAKVGSSGPNFVASRMAMEELNKDAIIRKIRQGEDEDTAEDSFDQLEEYEKRGLAKLSAKVKEEEEESDLVEIYDSSDEEEAKQDQEGAEDEGEEEESGEEEEKSICEESEEEEDEGEDEEGADDEEEDGEKAEEEGREIDEDYEDGSDGEKIDEGDGSVGDDEDSKDDGEGSGDDRKGVEEGDCVESMNGSDEGTGLMLRLRPRRHPTRRPHPSRARVAAKLGQLLLLHQ